MKQKVRLVMCGVLCLFELSLEHLVLLQGKMSLSVGGRLCKINDVLAGKSWLLRSVRQGTAILEVSGLFTDLSEACKTALVCLLDDLGHHKESTTALSADLCQALRACTLRQVSRVNDVVSYLGLQEASNLLACYTARQVEEEFCCTNS